MTQGPMNATVNPFCALAVLACLTALGLAALGAPVPDAGGAGAGTSALAAWEFPALIILMLGGALWFLKRAPQSPRDGFVLLLVIVPAVFLTLRLLYRAGWAGHAPACFWVAVLALWALVWLASNRIAEHRLPDGWPCRLADLVLPLLFGVWLLLLWEYLVAGFGIPQVLLPAPSVIAATFAGSLDILAADFRQTFLKAALAGYAIGCGAGFAVAIMVDASPFLKRGLLPFGNLVCALPIIGIAPIMVMWFGFDWPSKAAVVVVMTFFPMLINSVSGLAEAGALEKDLMRTYSAGYWRTLFALRLPAAMPFVFNALKINSTLALIGAIVAEFFGTPIVGMGFRISTEVGRMNIDMVWAEILVAALAGSGFYGIITLMERQVTFWHPSYRRKI